MNQSSTKTLSLGEPRLSNKKHLFAAWAGNAFLLSLLCMGTLFSFIVSFQLLSSGALGLLWGISLGICCGLSALFFFRAASLAAIPLLSLIWCLSLWWLQDYFVQGFILTTNRLFSFLSQHTGALYPTYHVDSEAMQSPELYVMIFLIFAFFLVTMLCSWGIFQQRTGFLPFLVTSPFFIFPLFFQVIPPFWGLCLVVPVWASLFLSPFCKAYPGTFSLKGHKQKSGSLWERWVGNLPVYCGALAFLLLLFVAIPPHTYRQPSFAESMRDHILNQFTRPAGSISSPGISLDSGKINLSNRGDITFTGKTMLKVRSQTSYPLFLRSYAGGIYDGTSWEQVSSRMYVNLEESFKIYNPLLIFGGTYPENFPGLCTVEIQDLRRGSSSPLLPQHTMFLPEGSVSHLDQKAQLSLIGSNTYTVQAFLTDNQIPFYETTRAEAVRAFSSEMRPEESLDFYVFSASPAENKKLYLSDPTASVRFSLQDWENKYLDAEMDYTYFALYQYTSLPKEQELYFSQLAQKILSDYGRHYGVSSDSPEELGEAGYTGYSYVVEAIREYLQKECQYTLTPGSLPKGKDFARYFLEEKQEGYCVHFATSATLLFRALGIPARYAEGYVVPGDVYQYMDREGWVSISDRYAHAWTEIYVPLLGWTPVEVTPGTPWEESPQGEIQSQPQESSSAPEISSQPEESLPSSSQKPLISSSPEETPASFSSFSAFLPHLLRIMAAAAVLLVLWGIRRTQILWLRRKTIEAPPIEGVLELYAQARKLTALGAVIPQSMQTLAEKAAFSNLPLNEEQRREMLLSYLKLWETARASIPRQKKLLFVSRFPCFWKSLPDAPKKADS